MKNIAKFLLGSCLSLFPIIAKAVDIQTINGTPVSVNWVQDEEKSELVNLSLAYNPGGIFSIPIAFNLHYFANGIATPSGFVEITNNNAITFTETYLRENIEVNSGLSYQTLTDFFDGDFIQNAQAGTDNFLGISFEDSASQPHYGWIKFELNTFLNGSPAVTFLSGYVSDTANTTATTGTVPEPSSLALLAAAGIGLVARFRRK